MSSILEGADRAYLREYEESEDERRLDALQDSLGSIRQATKGGKYLGSDVIDIMVEIQGFAEQLGIDPKELDYAENAVREAQNNLESAIYGLEEPFTDMISALQNRIDDARMDAEDLDEDQRLDPSCWKGYKKQGTKMKGGTKVNNCVKKEDVNEMIDDDVFNNIFDKRKDRRKPSRPDISSPKRVADRKTSRSGDLPTIRPLPHEQQYTSEDGKKSQRLDPSCWDGYKKQGTKMKGNTRVNNCVKKESRIAQGLSEMYDDVLYLMYIDGKLAMPTPITKKDRIKYERLIKNVLPGADVMFKGTPRHHYSAQELAEGNGNIRKALAGIILLGGLLGLENHQAQKMYNQSHQLQQLTQVYMVAKERGDEQKMKDVKRRIGNHKTRLDIGKGDVDFDGRPGNDDIKDIDYINPIEER